MILKIHNHSVVNTKYISRICSTIGTEGYLHDSQHQILANILGVEEKVVIYEGELEIVKALLNWLFYELPPVNDNKSVDIYKIAEYHKNIPNIKSKQK